MWQTKIFKTRAAFDRWIEKNQFRCQIEVVFVNNAYGVTYRKLRRIG